METIVTEQTESKLQEPAKEESADITGADAASPTLSNIFAQEHYAAEGGIPTDLYCPGVRGGNLWFLPADVQMSSL